MRRLVVPSVALVAALVSSVGWLALGVQDAGATTPVVYSYSPTSGPIGTVIHYSASGCGSAGGIFTLETNPSNPGGEQWSSTWTGDGTTNGTLTVPNYVTPGFYNVQAQCLTITGFDPTYSPCGFTVTSTSGTAGSCDSTGSSPPSVSSISPAAGPSHGGTAVTITGSGFTGATAVRFGSAAATKVVVVSDTEITARAPKGTAGSTVDVTVVGTAGTSATRAADEFTYCARYDRKTGTCK